MANAKIIEQKALVVDEIKNKFENAKSVVVFDPRGLKVSELLNLEELLEILALIIKYIRTHWLKELLIV